MKSQPNEKQNLERGRFKVGENLYPILMDMKDYKGKYQIIIFSEYMTSQDRATLGMGYPNIAMQMLIDKNHEQLILDPQFHDMKYVNAIQHMLSYDLRRPLAWNFTADFFKHLIANWDSELLSLEIKYPNTIGDDDFIRSNPLFNMPFIVVNDSEVEFRKSSYLARLFNLDYEVILSPDFKIEMLKREPSSK